MYINTGINLFDGGLEYLVEKKHYETIKRKKSSLNGLVILMIFVVIIALVGSGVGIYAATQAAGNVVSSSDVLLGVSVSGNDVIVDVFDSPKSGDIVCLIIAMEGYNIPQGLSTRGVENGKVIYSGIAAGITGSKQVSFKAQFTDGTTKTVWMDSLRFT